MKIVLLNREDKIQIVVIKGYCTRYGMSNTSEFMEELLKNQKKIRFSGAGASHQNEAAEHAINMLVNTESTIFMNNELRCTKETLSTGFRQCKWTIMYGSTLVHLIHSVV